MALGSVHPKASGSPTLNKNSPKLVYSESFQETNTSPFEFVTEPDTPPSPY